MRIQITYTEVSFSQENSAYTKAGFSLRLGFTKVVLTPKVPLYPSVGLQWEILPRVRLPTEKKLPMVKFNV